MIFYRAGVSLGIAAAKTLAPLVPKLRRGFQGREGLLDRVKRWRTECSEKPIWFHVASSGEFEQVLPILEALKKSRPETPLFLTYFSPSGERAVGLECKRRLNSPVPWDAADYSPLDRPRDVRAFLDVLEPRALVLIHREIWPELVGECERREIPQFLFAAFFPPKARKRLKLYRRSLTQIDRIGTIDADSQEVLQALLARSETVQCLGDPRIERALARAERARVLESEFRIWIAASIWPEDFRALRAVFARVARQPGWKVVVVPHEMSPRTLRRYRKFFTKIGKPATLWSELTDPDLAWLSTSPLIVDRVGFLAELYRVAEVVFVGGSFRARIHNVLEPAAHGRPILCGPYIENSAEATEMNRLSQGVLSVSSADELLLAAEHWLGSEPTRKHFGSLARTYLEARTGAGARYAELLSKI